MYVPRPVTILFVGGSSIPPMAKGPLFVPVNSTSDATASSPIGPSYLARGSSVSTGGSPALGDLSEELQQQSVHFFGPRQGKPVTTSDRLEPPLGVDIPR